MVADAESKLWELKAEHERILREFEALKASQAEILEKYHQLQLRITELEEINRKLDESIEERAWAAVLAFKSSREYTNALVEQSGDDYAKGYRDAKKDIATVFPKLDLSGFPLEDKNDTPQDSPIHSTTGD